MENILLKYFSGTGNSLRIMDVCNARFRDSKYDTALSSITENTGDDYSRADLIGFCFPVYAFGLPRICKSFLKSLPDSKDGKKVFLLVTAGLSDESGFSLNIGHKILRKKGYDVIYSDVIEMPSNWTTFDNPPSEDLAKTILKKGEKKTLEIVNKITDTKSYHHKFNVPKRMSYLKLLFEYVSFHYFGIHQMWKMFRVKPSCNACGTCEKICPTRSVNVKDGEPRWNSSCEQCMRCVNFCPKQAIFQTHGGETEGKNRYHEPHFKPKKITG